MLFLMICVPKAEAVVRYVSPCGSDASSGITASEPMLTVDCALSDGADTVLCLAGTYFQQVNLRLASAPRIVISAMDGANVVFKHPQSVLASGGERREAGKVYSFHVSSDVTFHDRNNRIWQEGIPDGNTLILPHERHPLQRGATYRSPATIIYRCAATSLRQAMDEIERSDSSKWFFDETQRRVYLSRPVSISASNPVCYSTGADFFAGGNGGKSVEMNGIEVWYMTVNVNGMLYPVIADCAARYVFSGGAFCWHNATGATFIRCEAVSATYGNTGDGFNGHSTPGHSTSATLIDCWSHDNCDDGFSDHERCRSTLMGGLFEYNGKAGVTPAYGSHNVSHGVLSRCNYSGFLYVGTVEDPADGPGSMTCSDCVSQNNDRQPTPLFKFPVHPALGVGYGVEGEGNTASLVRCVSIGDKQQTFAAPESHLKLK